MGPKPKRYQHQRCLHFITFSCYQRRKLLDSAVARDSFELELERVRRWYGCYLTGYVIMPEHVHLLISEPERSELSVVIQMLKQITSRKLRVPDLPRFWHVRYYDFPVWSQKKRVEKLRYIHRNPVTRGLVERPRTGDGAVFAIGPPVAQAAWKSRVNGQHDSEKNWVSCRVSEFPTLPQKTREGWGNRETSCLLRKRPGAPSS